MNISDAMREYRLPNPATAEDLEMRFNSTEGKVLNYKDRVLVAGYQYRYQGPCYYGAVYEFLTDDHTCEGLIGLREVSEVEFEDNGRAIEWAMRN